MNKASHPVQQEPPKHFAADHQRWLDDIQAWRREHADARRTLQRLLALLSLHERDLQNRASAIRRRENASGPPEPLRHHAPEVNHRECSEWHARAQRRHGRITRTLTAVDGALARAGLGDTGLASVHQEDASTDSTAASIALDEVNTRAVAERADTHDPRLREHRVADTAPATRSSLSGFVRKGVRSVAFVLARRPFALLLLLLIAWVIVGAIWSACAADIPMSGMGVLSIAAMGLTLLTLVLYVVLVGRCVGAYALQGWRGDVDGEFVAAAPSVLVRERLRIAVAGLDHIAASVAGALAGAGHTVIVLGARRARGDKLQYQAPRRSRDLLDCARQPLDRAPISVVTRRTFNETLSIDEMLRQGSFEAVVVTKNRISRH